MQSLEFLKARIVSALGLRSIVRTMKVLAAVGLRQAQRAREAFAAYAETAELALTALLRSEEGRELLRGLETAAARPRRPEGPSFLLVLGSDLGLCGQLNDRLARFAREAASRLGPPAPRLVAVGERLAARCEELGLEPAERLPAPSNPGPALELCLGRLLGLLGAAGPGPLPVSLGLAHARRLAGGAEDCLLRILLPPDLAALRARAARVWAGPSLPLYRMEGRALLRSCLGELLFIELHAAFVDALECENGARLEAMRSAELQVEERLAELRGAHNAARQEAITAELLDIVAGLEASALPAAAPTRKGPGAAAAPGWVRFL